MHRKRLMMHPSFVSAFSATVVSLLEIPPSTRGDAPSRQPSLILLMNSRGSFEGKLMTFPTGLPPGVTIKTARQPDGTTVPLESKWPTLHRDSGGHIQVAIATVTFDAPGPYQLDAEGLQEKRALYLDRFDFRTLVLKASFGSVGPVLFLTGFVWVIDVFVWDRKPWA